MFTYAGAAQALGILGGSSKYLGLLTSAPTQSGGGTEVSGNGYARVEVGTLTINNGIANNANPIVFPEPTGAWGTATYFGIYSAKSGGSLLYYGELKDASTQTQGVTIGSGYIFLVRSGGLDIKLDVAAS